MLDQRLRLRPRGGSGRSAWSGRRSPGRRRSTRVRVTSAATGRPTPARRERGVEGVEDREADGRPGSGRRTSRAAPAGRRAAASSFLTSRLPTCGPLPWVRTTSCPAATSSATGSIATAMAPRWASGPAPPSAPSWRCRPARRRASRGGSRAAGAGHAASLGSRPAESRWHVLPKAAARIGTFSSIGYYSPGHVPGGKAPTRRGGAVGSAHSTWGGAEKCPLDAAGVGKCPLDLGGRWEVPTRRVGWWEVPTRREGGREVPTRVGGCPAGGWGARPRWVGDPM